MTEHRHSRRPRSLLVVEDDETLRGVLAELFGSEGWVVGWARDGEDAMGTFRADAPDLVITDIIMPRLSGLDLVRGIRSIDWNTPILVLTGYSSYDNCLEALRAGANDFIEKPFENERLLDAANRLVASATNVAAAEDLSASVRQTAEIAPSGGEYTAVEIAAFVGGWAVQAGMQRRRQAIMHCVEILVKRIQIRAAERPTSADERDFRMTLEATAAGVELRLTSPHRDPAWERRPMALSDHDDTSERDRLLLHTFADEILSGSEPEPMLLRFFRPRPDRSLKGGA